MFNLESKAMDELLNSAFNRNKNPFKFQKTVTKSCEVLKKYHEEI